LTVILAFYESISGSVSGISESWISLQGMIPGIEKIQETLEAPDESVWKGKENLTITEGSIEFRDIGFSYSNSTPVLTDFSLKINSGDKIALVGKSGCGKTTLAYMTIGFYRPQKGQIMIDGEDITKFTLRSIRSNIGLIQQDVLVFDGSLRENIMIGNRDATENDLIEACKNAGIWDFIETLPEGIDTMIGVNGIDLSGGQKQRVAIARIYLKNPKIIIFDEATSALDAETEKQIHDSWKNVLSGRTSIVIAHRESSVMLCEKVVLMEDGRVVRTGAPNEMRENDEKFRELFAVKEEVEDD
jgi:ABC-type multidrug transport system fused ATPase/permease subunit